MRTRWSCGCLAAAVQAAILLGLPAVARGQASPQAQALVRQAQEALQKEDYRAAERYYRAAVAADRTSPDASCGLGQVYMALREFDKAVEALRNCKKYILTELRQAQAAQAQAQGSIEDEIREIRDTIQGIESGRIKTGGADTVTSLEQRIRELETMRNRGPVKLEVPAQISFALGTALLQVGRLDEAEGELLDALEADEGRGDVHNNLAAVYLAQQRWDEAAEQIRLAEEAGVQVNPQMKRDLEFRSAPGIATTAPAPPKTEREAQAVSIAHEGRTCALKGRFVRLEATVTPSWGVFDPVVRFTTEKADGWYSAIMLPAGEDRFAAVLPRPRSTKGFDYRIEVSNYDEEQTLTDEFHVVVTDDAEECGEAAADSEEAGSVLIIDKPKDVADAPPVPDGFSIRGTTADAGVLEMGENKALVWGGVSLGAMIAGGLAIASGDPQGYSGPEPFSEADGLKLVATDPPSGSTLHLGEGQLSLHFDLFSVEPLPGGKVTAEVYGAGPPCFRLEARQDIPARQSVRVVVSGPTVPAAGGTCDPRVPLEEVRVWVRNANGLGGFQTGLPPLNHFKVLFHVID